MPLTVSGAARRVSARARAVRLATREPAPPLHYQVQRPSSTAIKVAAALHSGRRRLSVAVRRPAWRLGCPSPTDAVSWTAGGRSPDRSRLLHPRRTSSPNVFSKSSTRRIRKFPERQGSAARTPPPLAPGTRWAQAASRPVFWAPSPLSLIVPFASEKGDDAKDLPSGLLVRSADPHVMCPAQIAPEWGRVGGS